MLELVGLRKSFDQQEIIKEANLQFKTGSFHAIIGPSGAGKTTLIKLIGGLIQPDEGEVYLDGNLLNANKDPLVPGYEEVKVVHQDFQLKANMSVKENINYAMMGYDVAYKTQKTTELLEVCRLDHLANREPFQLSGGQKQRVAIARALATEPEVILMDEPFSNLDPMTKNLLLQESKSIAQDTETTIVLVTHDTRDALEVAETMHILIHGGIAQSGSPFDVYHQPGTPEIANMLGYMNYVIEQGKLIGYWAENVQLGKGRRKGTVKQTIFKGPYQLLSIQIHGNEEPILAFDYEKAYQSGDEVLLQLSNDSKVDFGSAKQWEQWLLDR